MNVTDVKIRKLSVDDKMKAIVSVTIDNELAIHDLKIIKGQDRFFIAMPSRKTPDGRYVDIVHPISKDLRDKLEEAVLKAYEEALSSSIDSANDPIDSAADVK